jgi:hypothetical protein
LQKFATDAKRGDEAEMRIPTDSNERDKLLQRLREAVVYQIGLCNTAKLIEEMIDCDLSDVLKWVNDKSIVADDGMDLTGADLDEFLLISPQGKVL